MPITTPASSFLPEVFFQEKPEGYHIKNNEDWIQLKQGNLKLHLQDMGYRSRRLEGEAMSELDCVLVHLQRRNRIRYAGPLAGHPHGPIKVNGENVLNTLKMDLIPYAPGEFPLIQRILSGLFKDQIQLDAVIGWLSIATRALYSGKIFPGQVMVLCGPPNCGKSVFQNNIVTPCLGGRATDPFMYMSGATTFNAEWFGATHLKLEDKHASPHFESRATIASHWKQIAATPNALCHKKGCDPILLSAHWRMTMSMNMEEHNIRVLPPMSDDLYEKVMLLRAYPFDMPFEAGTPEQRMAADALIAAELPAFLNYLMFYEVPLEQRCDRYGIKSFHNADIRSLLLEHSDETRLLHILLDTFAGFDGEVMGSSEWILGQCKKNVTMGSLVDSVVPGGARAMGRMLANLCRSNPDIVSLGTFRQGVKLYKVVVPEDSKV